MPPMPGRLGSPLALPSKLSLSLPGTWGDHLGREGNEALAYRALKPYLFIGKESSVNGEVFSKWVGFRVKIGDEVISWLDGYVGDGPFCVDYFLDCLYLEFCLKKSHQSKSVILGWVITFLWRRL